MEEIYSKEKEMYKEMNFNYYTYIIKPNNLPADWDKLTKLSKRVKRYRITKNEFKEIYNKANKEQKIFDYKEYERSLLFWTLTEIPDKKIQRKLIDFKIKLNETRQKPRKYKKK